jgi:hypothetical protein
MEAVVREANEWFDAISLYLENLFPFSQVFRHLVGFLSHLWAIFIAIL